MIERVPCNTRHQRLVFRSQPRQQFMGLLDGTIVTWPGDRRPKTVRRQHQEAGLISTVATNCEAWSRRQHPC